MTPGASGKEDSDGTDVLGSHLKVEVPKGEVDLRY